jgi:hypothetical protein
MDDARGDRDEGMRRALEAQDRRDPRWRITALNLAGAYAPGWEGLFEEIRLSLIAQGLPNPPRSQVWSSLSGLLIRIGLFEHVEGGLWDQPRERASHASAYRRMRRTDVSWTPIPLAPVFPAIVLAPKRKRSWRLRHRRLRRRRR